MQLSFKFTRVGDLVQRKRFSLESLSSLVELVFRRNQIVNYQWTEFPLIAHAGGGIDGYEYTNSMEALINSYKNGFKLFELDLSLTSDGYLVARHGWDENYGQNFLTENGPPTYEQFINSPYYSQYTPIDFQFILKFLKKHRDTFIILDGKVRSPEDTKILYEKIGLLTNNLSARIKKRIIPQMFYEQDLEIIRQYGFHDVLYVVGREEYTPASLAEFCDANDIRAVSLSPYRVNSEMIHALKEKGIKIYVYTINDVEKMTMYFDMGVDGFFTDFIIPADLSN